MSYHLKRVGPGVYRTPCGKFEVSDGDTGWDVYYVSYGEVVNGNPATFAPFWRLKDARDYLSVAQNREYLLEHE